MRTSHLRIVPTLVIRVYVVSASHLCAMPLRSLWRNGEYVGLQVSSDCTVKAQLPGLAPTSIIRGKSTAQFEGMERPAWTYGDHLIPSAFGAPRLLKASTHLDGEELPVYIPLFEIARAWFLRNSELTSLMLSYRSEGIINLLVDESKTVLGRDRVSLTVRDGIPASAVPVVALIVLKKRARKACSRMILTFASCTGRNRSASIEAFPPMAGLFTLRIRGEVSNFNGKKSLLVHSIAAAELPKLPSIEWTRVNNNFINYTDPVDIEESRGAADTRHRGQSGSSVAVHPGFEPPKGSVRSIIPVETTLLGGPRIFRERSDSEDINPVDITIMDAPSPAPAISLATSGAGQSGSHGSLPKFKFEEAQKEWESHLLPATFDSIYAVMNDLNSRGSVRAATSMGTNWIRDERFGALTLISGSHRWAYTSTGERKCIVLEISAGDNFVYFFEIERRYPSEEISAGLVWKDELRRFFKTNIDTVLESVVLARGSWRDIRHPYHVVSIPHKFVSASTFASWLEKAFFTAKKPKKSSR